MFAKIKDYLVVGVRRRGGARSPAIHIARDNSASNSVGKLSAYPK